MPKLFTESQTKALPAAKDVAVEILPPENPQGGLAKAVEILERMTARTWKQERDKALAHIRSVEPIPGT